VVFPVRHEDVSQMALPDGRLLGSGGGVLDQDIGSPVVVSSSAGGRSGQKAEFLATVASGIFRHALSATRHALPLCRCSKEFRWAYSRLLLRSTLAPLQH
jgi:hypothetical protein